MRWETVEAKLGNERTVYMFLWLPVTINNETRWLERAYVKQRWTKMPSTTFFDIREDWQNIAFVD